MSRRRIKLLAAALVGLCVFASVMFHLRPHGPTRSRRLLFGILDSRPAVNPIVRNRIKPLHIEPDPERETGMIIHVYCCVVQLYFTDRLTNVSWIAFVLRIVLFWHIAKVSNNLAIVIQYSILSTLTHSLNFAM